MTDNPWGGFTESDFQLFQRYRCRACGGWSRDTKATARVHITGVAR